MKEQAFIFDMAGVLLDWDMEMIKSKVAEASALPYSKINAIWKNENYLLNEIGKINGKDYFNYFASCVKLKWTYEKWLEEWIETISINKNGYNLFCTIKSLNLPLYILSNLGDYHKKAVDIKFPGFWDKSLYNFFSFEVGLYKPDPLFYETACYKINKDPEDCYYFDDDADNIKSAQKLGINAFHFTEFSFARIAADCKKIGINVKETYEVF